MKETQIQQCREGVKETQIQQCREGVKETQFQQCREGVKETQIQQCREGVKETQIQQCREGVRESVIQCRVEIGWNRLVKHIRIILNISHYVRLFKFSYLSIILAKSFLKLPNKFFPKSQIVAVFSILFSSKTDKNSQCPW